MELKVSVKQLGKKHPILKEQALEIAYDQPSITLEQLLLLIVEQQVARYNALQVQNEEEGTVQKPLHEYLGPLMEMGKVGFGGTYQSQKVNVEEAQDVALQAYKDGLFAVFQGEEECSDLQQHIDLQLQQTFTFIRLTFLAGSIW
jgi:hypothetical protein